MARVIGNRKPREARRARKPLQDNWAKIKRGVFIKCTYGRCGHEWEYFGGKSWAVCPLCRSTIKVAAARRMMRSLR